MPTYTAGLEHTFRGGWKKSGSQEWDVAADAKILMLHIPNSDNRKRTRLWIEMLVTQRINIVFGRDGVAINNASVDCAATKHKAKVAARAALFANINTIDEYLLEQAFKMNPPLEVAKSINKTMLQKHGGLSEVFETPPFNQFVDDRKIKLGSGRSKTGSGKRKKKPFAFKGYTTAPYISRGYTKI